MDAGPDGEETMALVDTHCHLGMIEAPADEVVQRAADAGVGRVIDVGIDVASSAQAVDRADGERVWAAVGIHPHSATDADDDALAAVAELAGRDHVVAIGETGLDHYRLLSPPDAQERAFRAQLELARQLDLALVIHDRDAHDEVLAVLDDQGAPPRTVMHCFSGDADFVRACCARGLHVSFSGTVTFANAPSVREAAAAADPALTVVETDAPFLAPHPRRGEPNEPALLELTLAVVAEQQGEDVDRAAARTSANAAALFGLPDG